jgi:hypothetical protein
MSDEASAARIHHRGPARLLSPQEEKIFGGYVVFCDFNYLPTTHLDLRLFLLAAFGVEVKWPYLSKLMKRCHLSIRTRGKATLPMHRRTAFKTIVKFLREVRSLKAEPEQMLAFDKTFLFEGKSNVRHAAPIGTYVDHSARR